MPLVNVIRGERIPDAPLNIVTPIVRLPLWMVITWWVDTQPVCIGSLGMWIIVGFWCGGSGKLMRGCHRD